MEPSADKGFLISAIVPAYNEESNILNVLKEISRIEIVNEILVVCDGCTDTTAFLVERWGGAYVINLDVNQGKTRAVMQGVKHAKHELILLCDADLLNLKAEDLMRMIDKYLEGYDMVIMEIGSQPWFFRRLLKSQPAVSGTRILPKCYLSDISFRDTDRFKLEVRVNDYIIRKGLSIGISSAPDVRDLRKPKKYPFFQGLKLDILCALEVMASDGLIKIFKVLRDFRRIAALV